jgi:hypothetical protein
VQSEVGEKFHPKLHENSRGIARETPTKGSLFLLMIMLWKPFWKVIVGAHMKKPNLSNEMRVAIPHLFLQRVKPSGKLQGRHCGDD